MLLEIRMMFSEILRISMIFLGFGWIFFDEPWMLDKVANEERLKMSFDKLFASNINELKIVENFEFGGYYQSDDFEPFESEDTMSILNRYIDEAEVSLDKSVVQKIMQDVYQEACELV